MALMQTSFFSDALGMCCEMNVILPQHASRQIGVESVGGVDLAAGLPTLYLLHGLSDDHSIWLRRTSIERYVSDMNLAVVMPAVHRSFYTDMAQGLAYWTFISEELPALCEQFFRLSSEREDRFVAGLSMGGYGAFKLGLRCPDRYAAAASLSGVLDMAPAVTGGLGTAEHNEAWLRERQIVFGDLDAFANSENDTMHLAREIAAKGEGACPALYQICGEEDFLWEQNLRFRDQARELNLPFKWDQDAGYGHSWEYWDITIQRVLKWLPLRQPANA